MRLAVLCVSLLSIPLLSIVGSAEAKYDPCRSTGSPVLVPAGPLPRNAKLWFSSHGFDPPLTLRGVGHEHVITSFDHEGIDVGILAANETYELAFESWTFATFTTSSDVDATAPFAPTIRRFAIAHLHDSSHSVEDDDRVHDNWASQLRSSPAQDWTIDVELPAAPFVELEMTRGIDDGIHVTIHRDDLGAIGRSQCGPSFHPIPGEFVCLTIRALDLAGNRSQPRTRCTLVVDVAGDTTSIPPQCANSGRPSLRRDRAVVSWTCLQDWLPFSLESQGLLGSETRHQAERSLREAPFVLSTQFAPPHNGWLNLALQVQACSEPPAEARNSSRVAS